MRKLSSSLVLVWLVLAGCGADDQPAPPGSGVAGTENGGSAPTAGSGPAGAGVGAGAGQSGSGAGPQGGSSAQGGAGGAGTSAGSASGGSAGSNSAGAGGAGGTGPAVDPRFKLEWRDDFDSFDDARWSKQTHTFDENLSRFSASNVVVEGGLLKLRVTKTPSQDREYAGAEVATKAPFTYGRFAGRIKFCAGSGMVSSLFTYKQNVADSWQEIDIEHLGYLPRSIQYNLISGTLEGRVYQPKVVSFDWSPTAEFHDYVLEWLPDGVSFFIDGALTHRDAQSKLKDAQTLHMNVWPANNAVTQFAGTFDPSAVPCEAQYDWVEAYAYVP
jgi:endo-1,3-1,4-beta-glycanase ExoK